MSNTPLTLLEIYLPETSQQFYDTQTTIIHSSQMRKTYHSCDAQNHTASVGQRKFKNPFPTLLTSLVNTE